MKNQTLYTYELLMKMNVAYIKKTLRNSRILSLIIFVGSVGLIVGCILDDALASMTMYTGVFFLSLALTFMAIFMKNRKSKISEAVKKQLQENPNKTVEFQFEEDYLIINVMSDKVQSNTRIEYSYISQVEKIDDTSFYFFTKGNLIYVLEDEQGIDECFTYFCNKTKEFAGK